MPSDIMEKGEEEIKLLSMKEANLRREILRGHEL